ncbi:uncharacterized protein LOC128740711 [Sabethes cyaneus]|uniref:uncharacterized protein LOC128740711 n=1 Tax=Sabethes cyaneus TaxID=53552 RepID=UPI00237D50BD|nr:uncharacterized protein LOC128740711 [Sabethes cyaneus]
MAEGFALPPDDASNHNCMLCEDHDSVDDMVQCDACDFWAHYRCADVTDAVKDTPWTCSKCTNILHVPKAAKKGPPKKTSGKKGNAKSDAGSDTGKASVAVPTLDESLLELQRENRAKEKELEDEKFLHEKRLEMERQFLEKKRLQQREVLQKELAQEQEIMQKQLQDEQEFLLQRRQLRDKFQRCKLDLSRRYEEEDPVSGEGDSADKTVENWTESVKCDLLGAIPKRQEQATECIASKQQSKVGKPNSNFDFSEPSMLNEPGSKTGAGTIIEQKVAKNKVRELDELLQQSDLTVEEENTIRKLLNRRRRDQPVSKHDANSGPTQEQLAARQAVSKQLPVFRGEAEVWPLFISCYEYTTAAPR